MDLFKSAKTIRLRSHHNKYLFADEDDVTVSQSRSASSPNARWTVEFSSSSPSILTLKSCYGRYLTASNEPFLLGMTGRKVTQSAPVRADHSSVEWEPVRDGFQVRMKTRHGQFLRANGGLPPWRNSVTHDMPSRTSTQNWVLWDVEIVEVVGYVTPGRTPVGSEDAASSVGSTPSSVLSPRMSLESSTSFSGSPRKSEGRTIYYAIAEDNGTVDTEQSFVFKGTSVVQLTDKLEEETDLSDIIVCTRSPLNGQLYPLRLHLPPNNSTMHVIVVQASSRAARKLKGV